MTTQPKSPPDVFQEPKRHIYNESHIHRQMTLAANILAPQFVYLRIENSSYTGAPDAFALTKRSIIPLEAKVRKGHQIKVPRFQYMRMSEFVAYDINYYYLVLEPKEQLIECFAAVNVKDNAKEKNDHTLINLSKSYPIFSVVYGKPRELGTAFLTHCYSMPNNLIQRGNKDADS